MYFQYVCFKGFKMLCCAVVFAMLAMFVLFAMFAMFALRCSVVLLPNRSHSQPSQPICMEKLIDFILVLTKYQTCKKLKQFQSRNTFGGIVPAFSIYHVPFAVDLFFIIPIKWFHTELSQFYFSITSRSHFI